MKLFKKWLYKSIGIRKGRFLKRLYTWFTPEIEKKRGIPFMDEGTRQEIFDVWITHPIISVDRRNGRDIAKIPKVQYEKQYANINCELVTFDCQSPEIHFNCHRLQGC